MAQALFNAAKKEFPRIDESFEAISCGTGIGTAINPRVRSALLDIGIDISDPSVYFPKSVESVYIQERKTDIVRAYTMGCMENACPSIAGVAITGDWALEDPAKPETDVASVRDVIKQKVLALLRELDA